MNAQAEVLARVLTDQPSHGPVIVLRGPLVETGQRLKHGRAISPSAYLATGEHTRDEADRALAHPVENLTICTSGYHQIRAFLTFVQAALDRRLVVPFYNAPAPCTWEAFQGELEKIAAYQVAGHVASYEDGLEHLLRREWV